MAAIVEFFKENLFWILFSVISAAVLIIYIKLDEAAKQQVRKFFSPKVIMIITGSLVWFVWAKQGGMTTLKTANLWMPIIGLSVLLGINFIGALRYKSQQVICANGLHGSYSRPPVRINGFYIFALDSFNADGLSWDFAQRILVLREETVQFFDECAVSIARPTPCNAGGYDLPEDVKSYIDNNRFLKGRNKPVFYGWFDDLKQVDYNFSQLKELEELDSRKDIFNKVKKLLEVENPSVSSLFWRYKNQSKQVNSQGEILDATIVDKEKGVEHYKRIRDSYVDKGVRANEMKSGDEDY